MNVVLPEKNRIKKKQLFIYISIIIICIISVIIAFYVQFYTRIDIAKFIVCCCSSVLLPNPSF